MGLFPLPTSPHLLLVDADTSSCEFLTRMLKEEGYQITAASTRDEATAYVQSTTFDLILTDLFGLTHEEAWLSIQPLVAQAHPTPIAVLTAHQRKAQDISAFAFVCEKPSDKDELLGHIATTLFAALDRETDADTALLLRFFALLNQPGCHRAADLCSNKVIYMPPPRAPIQEMRIGREAFRQFLAEMASNYPDRTFDQIRVYPFPTGDGRIVRYHTSWSLPNGQKIAFSSTGAYLIRNGLIHQISMSPRPFLLPVTAGVDFFPDESRDA